ncbi:MAG: serine/threonine protein kinase, partial [Chloroflexales bacterium]|nr:serine/threonine protein kinase [Chloroflexales bacterium]
MRALTPGTTIHSRYQILALAGRGGMGAVYAARDGRLGATVALKQTLAGDEALRRAFRREARLLSALRHPALPRVLDHFEEVGELFLVMEYVPGDDLGALLARRRAPFSAGEALAWADALLDALEYLHGHTPPVVHRDIKPQNLKLTPEGAVVLLDFGLARGAAGGQTLMLSGATLAGYTPHYAPLEQIQGGAADQRADLYGLGATLYHLLAGEPPADALA